MNFGTAEPAASDNAVNQQSGDLRVEDATNERINQVFWSDWSTLIWNGMHTR